MRCTILEVETVGFAKLPDGVTRLDEAIGPDRGPGRPRRNRLMSEDAWVKVRPRSIFCLRPYSFTKPSDKEVVYGFAQQELGLTNGLLTASVRLRLAAAHGAPPGSATGMPRREPEGDIHWYKTSQKSLVEMIEALVTDADRSASNRGLNSRMLVRDLVNRPRHDRELLRPDWFSNDWPQSFRAIILDHDPDSPVTALPYSAVVETATGPLGISFSVRTLPIDGRGPHDDYLSLLVKPDREEPLNEQEHSALTDEVANSIETLNSHIWLQKWAEIQTEKLAAQSARLLDGSVGVAKQNAELLDALRIESRLSEFAHSKWTLRSEGTAGDSMLSAVEARLGTVERWERLRERFSHITEVMARVPSDGHSSPELPPEPEMRDGWDQLEKKARWQIAYHLLYEPARSRMERRAEGARGMTKKIDEAIVSRAEANFSRLRHKHKREEAAKNLDDRSGRVPPGSLRETDTREIVLHPFQNRYALFEEISASIGVTTFLTTASVLFLGVFLDGSATPGAALFSLTVILLFVASFGFLVATLGYGNASGTLARHGTVKFDDQIEQANAVSEYFGVYPLMLGIPTAVLASSGTKNQEVAIICISTLAVLAMAAYHYVPGTSLLERDISDKTVGTDRLRKRVFVPLVLVSMIGVLAPSVLHVLLDDPHMSFISNCVAYASCVVFIGCMVFAFLCAESSHERSDLHSYTVHEWDMLSEETPNFFQDEAASPHTGARPAVARLGRRKRRATKN